MTMTDNVLCLMLTTVFGVFLLVMHPTITAGDSGEIVSAAFSLGIPHPPGYPLYVTLAKLFTLAIPFGNAAYRVNILSALFGALSCLLVYLITIRIVGAGLPPARERQPQGPPLHLPAIFAAFSLALSCEFWYRSTVAEVYTLNTFLVLMIIYLLLLWRGKTVGTAHPTLTYVSRFTSHDLRILYLSSFLLGLGIGNHHTVVLVVPGAVVFVLWTVRAGAAGLAPAQEGQPQGLPLRLTFHVSRLTFFFLLGISIYLYLPLRSAQNPLIDWGNPENNRNFIDVFTRKIYLPEGVSRGWEMLVAQLKSFTPVREFKFFGTVLGLLGLMGLWSSDKAALALLVITFLLTSYGLIFMAGPSTADAELLRKFYLPTFAVFSIYIGIGMAKVLSVAAVYGLPIQASRLALLLAAVSILWQFSTHYRWTSNAGNYIAYDYGMNELNSLRNGSVYISKGEIKTFPLWYLQGVERYREDAKVVTAYFLTQGWYAGETMKLVGAIHKAPSDLAYRQMLIDAIYLGNAEKGVYTGFLDGTYIPAGLHTYTQGITFLLYGKAEDKPDGEPWSRYRLRGVRKIDDDMEQGIKEILRDYASSHYNTGLEYYHQGDKEKALAEFEKALAINPDDPDSLNNLATLYSEKGIRLAEAKDMAGKAFKLYTGESDKGVASETLKEIEKRQEAGGRRQE